MSALKIYSGIILPAFSFLVLLHEYSLSFFGDKMFSYNTEGKKMERIMLSYLNETALRGTFSFTVLAPGLN